MARKPASKPATRKDPRDRVLDAALVLAGEQGWAATSLTDVAARAGIDLAGLHRLFPGKPRLLDAILARVDAAVLAGGGEAEGEERPRDRLFDLLMRRFDVLSGHRAGIKAILRDLRFDPLTALLQARQLELSMRWTLQSAGISTDGLLGRARVQALGLLYGLVLRVWEQDDSPDLDRTMKALDQRLRQAEQWQNTFGRGRRERRAEEPPAAPEAMEGEEPTLH